MQARVSLAPGQLAHITLAADPQLIVPRLTNHWHSVPWLLDGSQVFPWLQTAGLGFPHWQIAGCRSLACSTVLANPSHTCPGSWIAGTWFLYSPITGTWFTGFRWLAHSFLANRLLACVFLARQSLESSSLPADRWQAVQWLSIPCSQMAVMRFPGLQVTDTVFSGCKFLAIWFSGLQITVIVSLKSATL